MKVIDPFRMCELFWPDVKFYAKQREVLRSVRDNDETFVVAGNMLGKDFIAAYITLWFFLSRHPVRIVTTSADYSQLESVMWGEIRRFIQTSKYPLDADSGGPLVINHLHIRKVAPAGQESEGSEAVSPGHTLWRGKGRTIDGLSYLIGRVAAKGEGMQGHHIADMGDGIPRTLFVADEACHDAETEVLTNTGWKMFRDLTGKETFLTMDPLTRVAEYRPATGVYLSRYKGPVYLYERRCGNFCVTPGHKMLWKRQRAGCRVPWSPYYLERIQDITGTTRSIPRCFVWQGLEEEWFSLPRLDGSRGSWLERRLPMRTWLEFLGWYVSEGNLGFVNGVPYTINISQADPTVLAHVASLARGMGFRPYIYQDTDSPSVRINERRLAEYMLSHGRYAWEKRVPEFVGTLSSDLIRVFLHAFKLGDGYDTHSGRDIYYTSSPYLADELQVLSFKAGREATVNTRSLIGLPAPHGISRHDGFVVGCSRPGLDSHLRIKRKYLQQVDYSGEVYCVRVPPYHAIFTRRNGDCMWGGNSGVDDETYDAADTWARRKLVIGNPLPTTNFFFRGVKGGDLYAKE